MADPVTIDLRHVARGLGIPLRQVEAVVELLDDGNTVPFITRYRKDQTGGLDEEQVRQIQSRLKKLRLLAERKETILRSIESQGKLTEKLAKQILSASTTKRLEDLYLPFKPKKQTLATVARERGLEPLAIEILNAAIPAGDLDARARDFVSTDRHVPSGAEALLGAGHILAEQFSERADLRQQLREILQRTGKLVCSPVAPELRPAPEKAHRPGAGQESSAGQQSTVAIVSAQAPDAAQAALAPMGDSDGEVAGGWVAMAALSGDSVISHDTAETLVPHLALPNGLPGAAVPDQAPPPPHSGEPPAVVPAVPEIAAEVLGETLPACESLPQPAQAESGEITTGWAGVTAPPEVAAMSGAVAPPPASASLADGRAPVARAGGPSPRALGAERKLTRAQQLRQKKEQNKKKAEERKQKAFRDYYNYREEIRKVPPHRVLAINRGERARVLKVKIECDLEAMARVLDELCVPPEHPHAELLRGCARDALTRLILPGLEREIRRELTERAELHAVGVFAKNLRNLLLTSPVRDRRVLAVDPGYRSGCKLAVLDEFGNLLGQGVIYLVGKPDRGDEARRTVLELVQQHQLSVVAIGNGTACRLTEEFFSEMLGKELKDKGVCYVIVNEAGASVYSTSRIGREEFSEHDASLRGAISIGRRLQDPLSELVKIEPPNLGIGLYQHDIKASHLRESLDEVVESCVNYVGIDLNTASPALLRYVSGLNQLTARRLYDYRLEHGPFRNREQLKEVPGIGDATFVQAAGFLKIVGGDNPLDATWIHPESYSIAARVMEKLGVSPSDLVNPQTASSLSERIGKADAGAMGAELQVGAMLLGDILAQLARPGRDPREDLPPPVFKRGVLKLEDLTPGMELSGTVLNVVDFGAFACIEEGLEGLIHVSELAEGHFLHPRNVVSEGEVVRARILNIDGKARRLGLSLRR